MPAPKRCSPSWAAVCENPTAAPPDLRARPPAVTARPPPPTPNPRDPAQGPPGSEQSPRPVQGDAGAEKVRARDSRRGAARAAAASPSCWDPDPRAGWEGGGRCILSDGVGTGIPRCDINTAVRTVRVSCQAALQTSLSSAPRGLTRRASRDGALPRRGGAAPGSTLLTVLLTSGLVHTLDFPRAPYHPHPSA